MALFGHHGNLSFTAITQPWLRQTAKIWALADLPRRRGRSGGDKTRHYLSSLALLSASLRQRADRGEDPAALGRTDIELFLNRLGYLYAGGEISELTRVLACREVRKLLTTARQLGATRPGGPAAGLSDQFALHRDDMPGEPEHGEPGRDLPPEILRQVCSHLGTLASPNIRTAIEILIDTGRRPDDVVELPLDCLASDPGGAPVLVYDNHKAHRLGRRLPIPAATAQLIRAQQQRVRDRFPDTPASELKLLPTGWANRDGRRPLTVPALSTAHRDWLTSLPPLLLDGGGEFGKDRAVPYSYRHTYAQRHADAGVAIDVLAELLDHRNLNVTRGYYRVGEERRRGAVNKVTAMQFDRHGNRIWRDARALLDDEHARYAVGSVAVPYGTCTEPSNVAAGGNDCPVRFRCAGCDHFRTDVSYLPDLTAYLDDLLRTRERLAAATGIDAWARDQAAPASRRSPSSGSSSTASRATSPAWPGRPCPHRRGRRRCPQAPRGQHRHAPPPPGRAGPHLRRERPGLMTSRKPAAGTDPPAHRDDAQRPAGRLRPAQATRPDRARPRRRQRDRDQRVGYRPCRRRRPDLPLPAPGPAREDPRGRSRTAPRRRHRRTRRHPRIPARRPASSSRTRHPAQRTRPPARTAAFRSARRTSVARVRARRARRHRRAQPENHPSRAASRRPAAATRRARRRTLSRPHRQPRADDPLNQSAATR